MMNDLKIKTIEEFQREGISQNIPHRQNKSFFPNATAVEL